MRLIDADALMKALGITDMNCDKCAWGNKSFSICNRGSDFADACSAIEDAPTITIEVREEDVKKYCRERCLCIVDSAWLKYLENGGELNGNSNVNYI